MTRILIPLILTAAFSLNAQAGLVRFACKAGYKVVLKPSVKVVKVAGKVVF